MAFGRIAIASMPLFEHALLANAFGACWLREYRFALFRIMLQLEADTRHAFHLTSPSRGDKKGGPLVGTAFNHFASREADLLPAPTSLVRTYRPSPSGG